MRWSATKLRWLLLGGVLLLAGVVAGFFGVARYRAGKIWQRILARNGVSIERQTNGVTYSQSSGGRTVFTLHASRATPEGKNRWALHDAVLILYGREPGRDDRIYGSEFEYDQNEGVARALGEVHMDLQAPEPGGKPPMAGTRPSLSFGPESGTAEDAGVIHVRTSGLVYLRKLGLAATGAATEFRFGGMTCTSRGAEFDSGQSVVRLLADVRLTGTVRNAPFTMTAARAELNRGENTADLASPVLSSQASPGLSSQASPARSARAGHALLHLQKDGSLQAIEAKGAVEMRDGTEVVSAPQMTASFGQEDRPERARLWGGVSYVNTDRARPAQGKANTVDLLWSGDGQLRTATGTGSVRLAEGGGAGEEPQRSAQAELMVASFAADGAADGKARKAALRQLHLTGGAEVRSASAATGVPGAGGRGTGNVVSADDLLTEFGPGPGGRTVAQRMGGTGHTRLEQMAADGGRQRSTGETLEVVFAPAAAGAAASEAGGPNAVSSAVQTGHVEVEREAAARPGGAVGAAPEVTTGHASKAMYDGQDGTLTLLGADGERARVTQPGGDLLGERITLHGGSGGSGDAEVSGGVVATELGRDGGPATHVLASRARMLRGAGLSEFYGVPGQPAQLWQGGSQVQAAQITLDERTHTLAARPVADGDLVQAVFATGETRPGRGEPAAGGGAEMKDAGKAGRAGGAMPEAGRKAVRVSAVRMDYDDSHRKAVFGGQVRMTGVAGEVLAERGVAFLKPAKAGGEPAKGREPAGGQETGLGTGPNLGGSLDHLVMLGKVRLTQPGRTGTGEELTFTAATDTFALTGTAARPPQVTGEQGSVITGATLLFQGADSTIVVAGAKGDRHAVGPARVHTELDLKQ